MGLENTASRSRAYHAGEMLRVNTGVCAYHGVANDNLYHAAARFRRKRGFEALQIVGTRWSERC